MKFRIYRAKDGWRWRLMSRNGRIIADSGESYKRKGKCRRTIDRMILQVGNAQIIEID